MESHRASPFTPLLFGATLFASAAWLFLLQPLLAKQLLPFLGGSPAVWNTAMVFFQVLLLAGYATAHALAARAPLRVQVALVGALFAGAAGLGAQLTPDAGTLPSASPVLWLLRTLTAVAGLPFFAVSLLSPLLQNWFHRARPGADPYWLYSLSNAGSLVALLGYPLVVEPNLGLSTQATLWKGGFLGLGLLVLLCGVVALRGQPASPTVSPRTAPNSSAARSPMTRLSRDHAVEMGSATVPVAPVGVPPTDPRPPCPPNGVSRQCGEVFGGTPKTAGETPRAPQRPASLRLGWLLLAAVPSSLMLGVTTHLTTDIASVPMLWAVPLTLYLLAFILAFAPALAHWPGRLERALPLLAVAVFFLLLTDVRHPAWLLGCLHLAFFFVAAWICHGRLAATRPAATDLTEFYLWVAIGGAMGGVFNSLLAPVIFTGVAEYPLAMVAALLVGRVGLAGDPGRERPDEPASRWPRAAAWAPELAWAAGFGAATALLAVVTPRFGMRPYALWMCVMFGLPLLAVYFAVRRPVRFALGLAAILLGGQAFTALRGETLHRERSFFGTIRVARDPTGQFLTLTHGTTIHGLQSTAPDQRGEPLAYYHRQGPLGEIIAEARKQNLTARTAVVGLGSGAMAAYARAGEAWTFYEIDPVMLRVARDSGHFSFLRDATNATVRHVIGDARLRLREAADGGAGLLVLDAFGSDTVPVHLLTKEAFALYLGKLAPEGFLALNISSRHLDLATVIADVAKAHRLFVISKNDKGGSPANEPGRYASHWLVLVRHPLLLGGLLKAAGWYVPEARQPSRPWTDDFSDVFSVFRWE